jgi:hypothetical protein
MSKNARNRLPALILAAALGLGLAACQSSPNVASLSDTQEHNPNNAPSFSDTRRDPDGAPTNPIGPDFVFHSFDYGCADWVRDSCTP